MKTKAPKRIVVPASRKQSTGPIRWDELPHQALRFAAEASMGFGSRDRASEDAKLHVLTERLWKLDAADHMNYIEIINSRTVEALRAIRDQYRGYLTEKGAKPIAEMHWVVVRHGVMDWAVMALRDAVFKYIGRCRLKTEHWESLYCFKSPLGPLRSDDAVHPRSPTVPADAALSKTINGFLRQNVFDHVITGGPFGRDNQISLGLAMPGERALFGAETVMEAIQRRKELWDKCRPWTEGLAMLWDAAQQEVLFQFDSLGDDALQAESLMLKLSAFQRIAYKHLRGTKSGEPTRRRLDEACWLALLGELDESGIRLDEELRDQTRTVLMTVRRKGHAADTWVQCYLSKSSVTLESGKSFALRRAITHAIHNAAKVADYQLAKVWNIGARK